MEIVAIVGDADTYHVSCARKVYGDAAIDRVISGEGSPSVADYGASTADDWPEDSEGNYLTAVEYREYDSDSFTNDLYDETGTPHSCGYCLGYLVEDESPAFSPLARDIMNLSVEYKDSEVTQELARAAHTAELHDTNIAELERLLCNWYVVANMAVGKRKQRREMVKNMTTQALDLAREWIKTWEAREVVKLHHVINEYGEYVLGDAEGCEWGEFDMRGYLDTIDDNCASCGRKLDSHAYYPVDDTEYYCPDCVVID